MDVKEIGINTSKWVDSAHNIKKLESLVNVVLKL
jgi:hypothetical protein